MDAQTVQQMQTSSLPSIFRTLPQSNRRRSATAAAVAGIHPPPPPAPAAPANTTAGVCISRLVSTECQTDHVVLQNVRAENARNAPPPTPPPPPPPPPPPAVCDASANDDVISSRPVSQYSDGGLSVNVLDVSCESPLHPAPAQRRRRREKRRQRRSSQLQLQQQQQQQAAPGVATQPLQQHVQQALQQQQQQQQQCPGQTDLSPPAISSAACSNGGAGSDHQLPDILNSHMPPPYSTLPHNSERCMGMGPMALLTAVPVTALAATSAVNGGVVVSASPLGASVHAAAASLPPAGGRR